MTNETTNTADITVETLAADLKTAFNKYLLLIFKTDKSSRAALDLLSRFSESCTGYEFLMKENCSFTFSFVDESINPFTIVIEAITGRVFVE